MRPILAEIGPFTIYTYGVFTAAAVLAAFLIASRRSSPYGLGASDALDILFVIFVGGIFGSRLFYVVQHPDSLHDGWTVFFRLDQGGLVWYGGFLMAVAFGVALALFKGQRILPWADFFSPILALSHAIGRLGCYFNGCCLGKGGHPVQLYEAGGLALLSALLFLLARHRPPLGRVFAGYLLGYGVLRFGLEFLRADQPIMAGLTPPQWVSLGLILAGLSIARRDKR